MQAGFARASITPPLGTHMLGFGSRDRVRGCESIHDDVHTRALYLEHEGEAALVMSFDLCFLGREEADRLKGAIGRRLDLAPWQILLNTSHNHVGPAVGTWYYAAYEAPDLLYLEELERATVAAAVEAFERRRPASLAAGVTTSQVPIQRRGPNAEGTFTMRPNPKGFTYNKLPVVLLRDEAGAPIACAFSISCHPSILSDWSISAEYPGVAAGRVDAHLGGIASMFLQGCGGDSKPRVIGREDRFAIGNWDDVTVAGETLASEVIEALDAGLHPIEPRIRCRTTEMHWALEPPLSREEYERLGSGGDPETLRRDVPRMWARRQVERLDRGQTLPTQVPITVHGQLGHGLRLVGLEGEAVMAYAQQIERFYGSGVTVPMGYTNGQGLYLVTSEQLDEGGMESNSFYEYNWPSRLAKGMEPRVDQALAELRAAGVE